MARILDLGTSARLSGIARLCLSALMLLASTFCIGAAPFAHCTTFIGIDGDLVLVGNNEDYGNPVINAWFLPATEETYGRFLIGTEGVLQGGLNDRGLVYDGLTIPPRDVARDDRPVFPGWWPVHVLETCSTVEEVLVSYEIHSFPGTWNGKLFFADAAGDAVLIEGDAVIRRSGRFLVTTNFLQSVTPPEEITCDRYLTVTAMLEQTEAFTPELYRDILDAVHVEYRDGAGTLYSTVYDLTNLTITCYLYHDFTQPVFFDLRDELARGPRALELHALFPTNPAYEAWRSRKLDTLARLIGSFRDTGVDPDSYDEFVGHYGLTSGGVISIHPPLALTTFSVARFGNRLAITVCAEGLSFELFPLGNGRFRSASMNLGTDFDVTFLRNPAGAVAGATFTYITHEGERLEAALTKIADHPRFVALPDFMAPLPRLLGNKPAPVRVGFWIGIGLVALGLLGLALVLRAP